MGNNLARVNDMDDGSWLDVNCGRCGRALVMRIDALRNLHTVECAECVGESNREEERVPLVLFRMSTERKPDLALEPLAEQRRGAGLSGAFAKR